MVSTTSKKKFLSPKRPKVLAWGPIMRNKRIYPCPGRYYLHINDSEITIILGLMYQSYTIGLTHKHTAVLNYWTKQTVWRNNVIHILLEVHSGRFCGTCFDFIWGRVNCSKRITFRDLFSMVEETVVLEAQGAQIRIFKQLNPTPWYTWAWKYMQSIS